MWEALTFARKAREKRSRKWVLSCRGFLITVGFATFVAVPTGSAQDRSEIFAKKAITIYVGNTAGGSYDLYGRLAARFIGKFIPGNPSIVVQNMPGAGSLRVANFIYGAAPKDGTALGIVVETVAIEQALGNSSAQYDARKYTWIGRLAASAGIHMMWHTSKVQSLDDAKKYESLVAGTGSGSLAETIPTLLNALIETKFKIVRGYPASNEAMLAMERGEVEGVAANLIAVQVGKGDWLRDHKVKVILQDLPARRVDLPEVPALGELGDTLEAKQLFRLYAGMGAIGRSIFAPPGVPVANTGLLREAFSAMGRDPEFIQAAKQLGGELELATGEELQQAVINTLNVPASAIERARAIFAR
jgi:tripartite-type tricarboxylate transporter receptor subunit TctC